ncbi:hypothetical protein PCASD_22497 [Puccinia coronata f. sp. avenae]|uniref:Uncharacterized protein n=1 Tax=Puccinia coronata f. sp. avenae TaxID=200324 RepID=A0A2N5TRG9_9BASI|nr:hypothetical protein PCASD_22497 [Puccinia coronata f. sp. avenae]
MLIAANSGKLVLRLADLGVSGGQGAGGTGLAYARPFTTTATEMHTLEDLL